MCVWQVEGGFICVTGQLGAVVCVKDYIFVYRCVAV